MPLDDNKRCFIKMQVKKIKNKAKWTINKNSFVNYCEEVVQDEPTTMLTTLTAWPSSTLMPTVKSTAKTILKLANLPASTQTEYICDNEVLKAFIKVCVDTCLKGEDVAVCVGKCATDASSRKTECDGKCSDFRFEKHTDLFE